MWEDLTLKQKAEIMKMSVAGGVTDIDSIRKLYNDSIIDNSNEGNMGMGGSSATLNNPIRPTEHQYQNAGKLKKWKALNNIDYEVVADPTFTRDRTGTGSIEYFAAEHPEGITYINGYHRDHPMPGRDVILYNPNDNDEQDIRLDALHIMPKDPTYAVLNDIYRAASWDARDDNYFNAKVAYTDDRVNQAVRYVIDRATGKDTNERYYGTDPFIQYFENEADGTLRSLLMEGDEAYRKSKRYYGNKEEVRQWNAHLMPHVNAIQQYLETGERPDWLLPEVTIVGQKKALGGHLFNNGGVKQSYNPVSMIESFEGFRASPYRDGKSWSVGYGQHKEGYGANLDWNALLSGKKKISREEAHQQVINTTNDLKRQLKRTLGEKLYDNLTPGQLTAYLDTGYQRPASMIAAAKVHANEGPGAAASMLRVNYPGEWQQRRNAARMAAFVGNDDAFGQLMAGATGFVSSGASSNVSNRMAIDNSYFPLSSQNSQSTMIQHNAPQTNSWLQYLNSRNKSDVFDMSAIQMAQQPKNNSPKVTNNTDFSNLKPQQSLSELTNVNPTEAKRIIEYGLGLENNALWNSPYLLFNNSNDYLV